MISNSLNINNINVQFESAGQLKFFHIPANSSKYTIFTGSLWIGGYDADSQLHVAAELYNNKSDFFAGPAALEYSSFLYNDKYNRVWKINHAEIEYHKQYFNLSGYKIPESILQWPGNGNTANGERHKLAPYSDVNLNNRYDPENGDYPLIYGDQAVLFIMNDLQQNHISLGRRLGIEVHGMAYAFAPTDNNDLSNTVFLNYKIINTSDTTYNDLFIGLFSDMDIGGGFDDFNGCDTLLNMFYSYNGDEWDGIGNGNTYGQCPPVQGAVMLNKKPSHFVSFLNSSSNNGDPRNALHYYYYMTSRWKNGSYITDGCPHYSVGNRVNFMYPGYPETATGWTAMSCGDAPNDCRGVLSAGPFTFHPADTITLDIAFPYARADSGNHLTSLPLLRQRAQNIGQFYQTVIMSDKPVIIKMPQIELYPNPSSGYLTVIIPGHSEYIFELYNLLGKKVFSVLLNQTTNTFNLKQFNGLYIYHVKNKNRDVLTGKLLIN